MQTLEFRAMNTSILLAAEGEELAIAGLQAARALIESSELRFSRFLVDSELSMLNRSTGHWFPVSDDLLELITLSLRYFAETEGLFDPSILPDLKRVGYDRSMELLIAQEKVGDSRTPRTVRPSFSSIEIDLSGRRVRLPQSVELDLGGIAKGWIVEQASNLLRTYSSTCAVSAGGDIKFTGFPEGGKWRVELEDPRDPEKIKTVLFVDQSTVVTSSITKRTWNQGGLVRHHLIDPRTGEPAVTNWLSVTVIAPEITDAEVYAKALLIGGEIEAKRLMIHNPGLAYISVDLDGNISGSIIGLEYLNDYHYEYR